MIAVSEPLTDASATVPSSSLSAKVDALTPAMLQEYAKRAFLDANRTTVTLTSQAARPQRKPAAKTAKGGGR